MMRIRAPLPRRLEKRVDQRRARFVLQFVQHVSRDDGRPLSRRRQPRGVALPRASPKPERPIRPPRLVHGPGVPIDPRDLDRSASRQRPRRARRAGAASDIENRGRRRHMRPQARGRRDPWSGNAAARSTRRTRPACPGVERPLHVVAPPGHVARRQRPQRARDFLHAQIRQMSRFQLGHPLGKRFAICDL